MPRHAAFTIVQDDPVNLRIWLAHYRKTYGVDDVFVLHHPKAGEYRYGDDGWVADASCDVADGPLVEGSGQAPGLMHIIPVFREESFDHAWLRETVQAFQRFLLQSYDTVLFAEVDEIVAPDPRHWDGTFREYIDAFAASGAYFARCTGHEVVHDYAVEPPIDQAQPLLAQRKHWYRAEQYCKTLLSKAPITWENGFHTTRDLDDRLTCAPAPRVDLLLLHLHKLDFGHALERHRRSAAQKWAARDVADRQGFQNQVADESWLRNWWLDTVDRPGERARWQIIPDEVKAIL